MTVVDLVYNPMRTRLLLDASQAGAKIVDGLNMLILQGVAAMEKWSGRRIGIGGKLSALQQILTDRIS
jgi:shikimate dehydrogenase